MDSLAFDCNWSHANGWLVPLVYLIPRVITHFITNHSRDVLAVPLWPPAIFWPYLVPFNGTFRSFVVDCIHVQDSSDVFVPGL